MKKRWMGWTLALLLALSLGWAQAATADSTYANTTANCLEFFPATIRFTSDQVQVVGYFFNFTLGKTITGMSDIVMTVYDDNGNTICKGEFTNLSDSLRSMSLYPGLSLRQQFNFNTVRSPSNYDLDSFSVSFGCSFTSKDY